MSTAPLIQPEPEPQPTAKAYDEAAFFEARERLRSDKRRSHFHWGGICIFWFSILVVISMSGVLVWHIITPDAWHFLNQEGRDKLQTILVAILGSSFATSAARRWIGDKPNPDPAADK